MVAWGDIFKSGSTAEQFLIWGVAQQLLGPLLQPILTELGAELWQAAVEGSLGELHQPLSPADLADQVVRQIRTQDSASPEAAKSGVSPADFQTLVDGAGEPPGLEFLLQAYRRGYIPFGPAQVGHPSVAQGVATSRVYDYWLEVVQKMLDVPISVADAVAAYVRGQISLAESQAEAYASGITAERWQILVDSAGRPPGPAELLELARRKLIPWNGVGPAELTFQQGIYEGDTKDKWEPLLQKLGDYIPPPRTVTALERSGAITSEQAQQLYQDSGLSPELAAAYAKSASGEKLAGSKALAEGVVLQLYQARAMTETEAAGLLGQLGYSSADVTFLLELTDLRRELSVLNSQVSRIGTLYVGHKITRQGAAAALAAFQLTPAHADALLKEWDVTAAANVRPLTEAQIVDAWAESVYTEEEAMAALGHIGFTPFDAWTLLSIKNKGALPNRPAQGPAGPGVNP